LGKGSYTGLGTESTRRGGSKSTAIKKTKRPAIPEGVGEHGQKEVTETKKPEDNYRKGGERKDISYRDTCRRRRKAGTLGFFKTGREKRKQGLRGIGK